MRVRVRACACLFSQTVYLTPPLSPLSPVPSPFSPAASSAPPPQLDCARRVCEDIAQNSQLFERASALLAHLDVSAGLARIASLREYVRPTLTDGTEFEVAQGRHAILDAMGTGWTGCWGGGGQGRGKGRGKRGEEGDRVSVCACVCLFVSVCACLSVCALVCSF